MKFWCGNKETVDEFLLGLGLFPSLSLNSVANCYLSQLAACGNVNLHSSSFSSVSVRKWDEEKDRHGTVPPWHRQVKMDPHLAWAHRVGAPHRQGAGVLLRLEGGALRILMTGGHHHLKGGALHLREDGGHHHLKAGALEDLRHQTGTPEGPCHLTGT